MSEITEKIKEKLDIVEVLKDYIELKPAGKNLKALCPFHKEKTPSFMVSPDRQSWYCFGGCNEGGDIFGFLMKYENLEFYEVLKMLAEKAGIELKKIQGAASDYKQYGILYEINNAAKDFWMRLLCSNFERSDLTKEVGSRLSAKAFNYLLDRGLKKEIIEEFELGFASDGQKDQLTQHLISLGFDVQDIERAGLSFKTERGTYWDRFHGRIMFPIYNHFGKVVGFTGRVLPVILNDSEGSLKDSSCPQSLRPSVAGGRKAQNDNDYAPAKYINSPETPIFNKSKILYGFHKAKKYIREQKLALLVEGQMDFLMAYQDNIKNIVATSGTALTNSHLQTLRKTADKLILSFDSDEAGQLAAERSIDLAAASDFMVKVLTIAEGKDPAEVVRKQSGELIKIIGNAQPAMNFYLDRYLTSSQKPHEQKSGIRIILAKAKNIFSEIERSGWIRELAVKTGIGERTLINEMEKLSPERLSRQTFQAKSLACNNGVGAENNWSRKQLIAQRIIDLGGQLPEGADIDLKDDRLALRASLENSRVEPDKKEEELRALIKQLQLEIIREKRQQLRLVIAQAEMNNQSAKLEGALQEFDIISRELHNLTHDEKENNS